MSRRMIFVDMDNACATGAPTCRMVEEISETIQRQISYAAGDQVVIATSHFSAHALFGWTTACRRLLRSGQDGADLALIEALDDLIAAGSPREVVICSGDRAFVDVVGRLQRAGFTVHVVAPRGGLSARLKMAANSFEYLEVDFRNSNQSA